MRQRKLLSMLLASCICLMLVLGVLPVSAKAADINVDVRYKSAGYTAGTITNRKALENYLLEQLTACNELIDVSAFNIENTEENRQALRDIIFRELAECFHVDYYQTWYQGTQLVEITPTYLYTKTQYQPMLTQIRAAKAEMLKGIKGNSNLNDMEKALLLHDRLALHCEYDYNNTEHQYDIYGAMVNGISVCQGYAEAYDDLMDEVGIDSYVCESDELWHAWNIIKVGGKWYHVDVTWDDIAWKSGDRGALGAVEHENFLCSSEEFFANGHDAYDYDTTPNDTTYDNAFWRDSTTAFQLIGNNIYYINGATEQLNNYTTGATLASVSDTWLADNGYYWTDNYARLSTDGTDLFYSTSTAVWQYDLSAGSAVKVYSPSLSGHEAIYGLDYEDGYLVCEISVGPPGSYEGVTNLRQTRTRHDYEKPTFTATVTNNVATYQTVKVNMTDNVGIAGYYWGTDPVIKNNAFTAKEATTASLTVKGSGTYYFAAVDLAGNVSQAKSFTFYRTQLNKWGGNLSLTHVITLKGNRFTFPTPTKLGYEFKGWSANSSATTGVMSIQPTENDIYYAIYEAPVKVDGANGGALVKAGNEWYYYTNGILDKTDKLASFAGKVYHVKDGKWQQGENILYNHGTKWYYVKNGVVNTTTDTLFKFSGKWYHVKNGYWQQGENGFYKYNSAWCYLQNGVMKTDNTLVKVDGKWYHIDRGQWVKDTTLVKYNGVWCYVKDGLLNTKEDAFCSFNGKWYHVKDGRWQQGENGMLKRGTKWYAMQNGVVNTADTLFSYDGKLYHIKSGYWQQGENKLYKYAGEWYALKNGVVYTAKTLFPYSGKLYYISGGKWTRINTTVTYNGRTYKVVNGLAV